MTSTSLMTTYYLRYVGDGTVDLERGGGWEEGESEWEYLHSSEIQSWGVMTSTSLMTTYYLRYVGDGTVDLERGRGGGGRRGRANGSIFIVATCSPGGMTSTSLMTTYYLRYVRDGTCTVDLVRGWKGGGGGGGREV